MKKGFSNIPLLFFVCLIIISNTVFSHIKVSGRVVAAGSLQPLEYLPVAEYGEIRTVTNIDQSGSLTIFVADQNDSLAISFVCYKTT
jgi:uncharacterized membrane protein